MVRWFVSAASALALSALLPSVAWAVQASPAASPLASAAPSPAAPPVPVPGTSAAPAAAGGDKNANLPQFDKEDAAQQHCPKDEVVWLNLKNDVYFAKDSHFYGKTQRGAYVCRKEANAAGDRESNFDPLSRGKAQF